MGKELKFDATQPHATCHGDEHGRIHFQNGNYFDSNGDHVPDEVVEDAIADKQVAEAGVAAAQILKAGAQAADAAAAVKKAADARKAAKKK